MLTHWLLVIINSSFDEENKLRCQLQKVNLCQTEFMDLTVSIDTLQHNAVSPAGFSIV